MKWLDAVIPQKQVATEDRDAFLFGGSMYPILGNTTWGSKKADPIADEFVSYVEGALKMDGVISAIEMNRFSLFSEARFQWQALRSGRPGDLFGTPDLALLERPWVGGTTGDLLTRMLLDADMAGNSYWTIAEGEIANLRPDWVEIALTERRDSLGRVVGMKRVGYQYYHGGPNTGVDPIFLPADEVMHFAPYPDPVASYRGMSWMTPVIREIQADRLATEHKAKFFENAATPNLHVSYPDKMKAEHFAKLVEMMDAQHKGASNAYKTLYTDAGADVTVLGQNMQQMDFKSVQGAGETRLAAAAGVPAVIVGLSEGMQGSSLNAGNYTAAKRNFADKTMRPLWRNAAGSLETLFAPPAGSRLWYDDRDVAFLRDDSQDRANIQQTNSISIRNYTDAGFTPESAVAAVLAEDESLLKHSGLFSVQLNVPESGAPEPKPSQGDE